MGADDRTPAAAAAPPDPVGPPGAALPVRWNRQGVSWSPADVLDGTIDVADIVAVDVDWELEHWEEAAMAGEAEPDASTRGWVVPPGGHRVDAIFVLSTDNLGIGRHDTVHPTLWLKLAHLRNLDAIGDPVDGRIEVEIVMDDGQVIGAGWDESFCDAVVATLRRSLDQPEADTTAGAAGASAAAAPPAPEAAAPPAPGSDVAVGSSPFSEVPAPSSAVPTMQPDVPLDPAAPAAPAAGAATRPRHEGSLVVDDVVYLGGHADHTRRRKRCTLTMHDDALELVGPGDLVIQLDWSAVRSIEVQNSDEARFRMNTKIHRDSSALVVECDEETTILLEARDCPTIALRGAIAELLADQAVVVA